MTDEEWNAIKARLKAGAEHSRTLNEVMRKLGAPSNWRDLPPVQAPAVPVPTDAERQAADDAAAGFVFGPRAERMEEMRLEHEARRRRAAKQTEADERLWRYYRDAYGLDEANRMMGR